MTEPLHIQLGLKAPPDRVFQALTQKLPDWFAEQAEVSLADKRYDFWGRFTPEAPDREGGHHPLLVVETNQRLHYHWRLRGEDTTVELELKPHNKGTRVIVQQDNVAPQHDVGAYAHEDFWFLSLENLRRHLDGKRPVLCDFSAPMLGDIHHTLEIEGTREAAFEVLVHPDQLNRWIASKAVVEARAGGVYDLGWTAYGPSKILDIVPGEKLAYSWPEKDAETVVTWTLEGSGGKTRLTIVHSGFAPDKKTGGYKTGWLNFASWVRSIVEYGADWKPSIKRIPPGMERYYPASVTAGQSELV